MSNPSENENENNDTATTTTTTTNFNGDCSHLEQQLLKLLDASPTTHFHEIMKQPSLKLAHSYCKLEHLPGQQSGPLIENYIQQKYGMEKVPAGLCAGDLKLPQCSTTSKNFELKISLGGNGTHNRFNYVQLRMNHDCDYLLTAYHLTRENAKMGGDLFVFRLSKDDIRGLILSYGSYAHGTVKKLGKITEHALNDVNNSNEYAIRPVYNSECWKSLLRFRIDELCVQPHQLTPA